MIQKAYKFRIYPNKIQKQFIDSALGQARFIYNYCLDLKIKAYEADKTSLSKSDIDKAFRALRNSDTHTWLKDVPERVHNYAVNNLDIAYKNFFRTKKGFPKFKSRYDNHHSFQTDKCKVDLDKSTISCHSCKGIRIRGLRKFDGVTKTCTFSRTPTGKYFVSILVEEEGVKPSKVDVSYDTAVGIDFGIKHFATHNDGTKVDNPKFLEKQLKRLARAQRSLSRKQKGSNNRAKQRIKVAKIHEKVANQRKDFHHKVANDLLLKYDTICTEDLNIAGMIKNRKLSRRIADVGWGNFGLILAYKAEWQGKNVTKVGRFYPSSKTCSCCGEKNYVLRLQDRMWVCASCGTEHERDENAAKNIRLEGVKNLLQLT